MSHTVTTIEVLLYSQARSSVKKNANRIKAACSGQLAMERTDRV